MIPRERADYSAIVDRPPPQAARQCARRVLDHRQLRGVGHRPADGAPGDPGADRRAALARRAALVLARVQACGGGGAWRFFELYEPARHPADARHQRRAPARTIRASPRRRRSSAWEFMGHAYDQMPIHKVEDQRGMINRSMDIIERFAGKRPVGWLGPGLTQTLDTPELLVEAGVKYIGDWVYDDEPTVIRTAKGPLVTLPYTGQKAQRHHHDDRAASSERLPARPRQGPVRPAVSEGEEARQDHGAGGSIPTSAGSRTGSSISSRSTST